MSAQFENSFTSQFASVAARANQLALDTLEQNVNATTTFFGEFAQARDLGTYQTLWPKACNWPATTWNAWLRPIRKWSGWG